MGQIAEGGDSIGKLSAMFLGLASVLGLSLTGTCWQASTAFPIIVITLILPALS